MNTEPEAPAELTVYYDGACPLCTAEIEHYETREGADKLCFLNIAEPGADAGPNLQQSDALKRFHVRKPDGTVLSGAAAFIEIWTILPGWHWLARLARLPGVPVLLEVAYRIFLPIRPALSWMAARLGAKPRTSALYDSTRPRS
ncbi:MAG: DUF393 domain-containing protein [Pseudomonadota bacterium]